MTDTTPFDQAARTWDDNPKRHHLMTAIAGAIQEDIQLDSTHRVMEYGCGTAAVSLLLADIGMSILAVDASEEMLKQAAEKVKAYGMGTIDLRRLDLTVDPLPPERFDAILCAMALHHIEDVPALLTAFGKLTVKGGSLAIADLYTEDGSFHGDMQVPHDGFDPDRLAAACRQAGFEGCRWRTVHHISKNDCTYPIFLLTTHRS